MNQKPLKEYASWSEFVLDQDLLVGDLPTAILAVLEAHANGQVLEIPSSVLDIADKTSRKARKKAHKERQRDEKLNKKLRLMEYVEKHQEDKERARCRRTRDLWERWAIILASMPKPKPVVGGGGTASVKRAPVPVIPVCKYCGRRH